MAGRTWSKFAAAALGLALGGCFDEPPLPETGVPIFLDAFAAGLAPNPFDTAVATALQVDTDTVHAGSASVRLDVPPSSSGYAGGAVLASAAQDLSETNALVFWAKASRDTTLDMVGFGLNFDPYPSTYRTTLFGLPLTTEWTRHVLPIPDPARLTAERGMFWYVDTDASGVKIWLDEVKFDAFDAAALELRPSLPDATLVLPVGGTELVAPAMSYTDLDGTVRSVDSADAPGGGPAPGFFTFTSSDPAVASVDAAGTITGVSAGEATIRARLGRTEVPGTVTASVVATAPTTPAEPAPTPPARDAADVVSLYTSTGAYDDVPADTWQTSWSAAGPASTFTIPGTTQAVKKYTALKYAGVEFLNPGPHVDASEMTTMHVDLWTPDADAFHVKLVAFDGITNIGEAMVGFGAGTIRKYRWVSLEIPLSSFPGVDLANLGQIVWVRDAGDPEATGTFFLDNVYFHR